MTSFTLPASTFRALIVGALEAASTDTTLPNLSAVNLAWHGATLTAEATDRYRLVEGSVPVIDTDGDGAVLLARDVCTAIVKALPSKASRRSTQEDAITVYVDGDDVLIRTSEWERKASRVEGEFPRVASLWPDPAVPVPTGTWSFDAAYIASLARIPVASKATPWAGTFYGEGKPAVYSTSGGTGGISWRYLLMPLRVA